MPQAVRLIFTLFLATLCLSLAGAAADLPKLRFSLPPLMGSLPAAFADSWGLFEAHGVNVELVALNDDTARQQALVSREIDGMICDVTTAIRLSTTGTDVVITSTAYQPPQTGSLAILTTTCMATAKGITSLDTLLSPSAPYRPSPITFTTESDLEFLVDTLLESLGYTIDPETMYVHSNHMPNLAARLAIGGVEAAVLPEPYGTYMSYVPPQMTFGCQLVHLWDFSETPLLPSVIVFRRETVERNGKAIDAFYAALREAIERLNAMGHDEMVNEGVDVVLSLEFFPGVTRESIPLGVLEHIDVPQFDLPGPLDPEQFAAVLDWMNRKHYTWKRPEYTSLTTERYLQ